MKLNTESRLMTLWVVVSVALCFNIRNSVSASKQCHFPVIFNFGDSNSDTGGLSAAFGQPGPPQGESYFHHPAGRYCDGRLIVDFIEPSCCYNNMKLNTEGSLMTLCVVVSVALCFNIRNSVSASKQCHFPVIFNFGDSNSDTGGLSAAFGQAGPPHGESYFHHPAGRYCDGRLVVDFIAKKLGLPYLNAFLDSVGSNYSHGANFATAGSTIRPQNTTLHQTGGFSPFSLDVQFNQFSDFQRRTQFFRNKGGVYKTLLPKAEDFSQALYTFDIGQNDLTSGYFHNMSTDQVKAYVPDVLAQFKNVIKYVYNHGGRSFWVHNTGPVGCLPYIMDLHPVKPSLVDKAGCATPYNEVAKSFNRELKEVVVKLRKELPMAAITYVDVYAVKYSLISHPKKHGFEEPLRACCGHGGKYNYNLHTGCGAKIKIRGKEILVGKPCKDPSVWVNWDGVHYTEAANKWVLEQIVDGAFSDPPIPLNMACHKHL